MITGDIKETAETIGKSIGIVSEKDIDGKSFTGAEFESFSLEKQNEIFDKFLQKPNGMIFSRTEPKHKRQLVQLLSKHVKYFLKFFINLFFIESNSCYDW